MSNTLWSRLPVCYSTALHWVGSHTTHTHTHTTVAPYFPPVPSSFSWFLWTQNAPEGFVPKCPRINFTWVIVFRAIPRFILFVSKPRFPGHRCCFWYPPRVCPSGHNNVSFDSSLTRVNLKHQGGFLLFLLSLLYPDPFVVMGHFFREGHTVILTNTEGLNALAHFNRGPVDWDGVEWKILGSLVVPASQAS